MQGKAISYGIRILCLSLVWSAVSYGEHLLIMSHRESVSKQVSVYTPQGDRVLAYVPGGGLNVSRPRFIAVSDQHQKFLVTTPDLTAGSTGLVHVFDYGAYTENGTVDFEATATVGGWPLHAYTAPSGAFAVAADAAGEVNVIDADTLAVTTYVAGATHATLAYAGDYLFATRFPGDEDPHPFPAKMLDEEHEEHGEVDVVDLGTGLTVATVELTLPVPHSLVYSTLTDRVYVSCEGGVEVLTAQPPFVLESTIAAATEEALIGTLRISPDGRYLIGAAAAHEHEHEEEAFYLLKMDEEEENPPYLWVYDLVDDTSATLEEFPHCNQVALSPNGQWVVGGAIEAHEGEDHEVVVARIESGVPVEVARYALTSALTGINTDNTPARAGIFGAAFAPDGDVAYLTILPEGFSASVTDQVMAIDVSGYPAAPVVTFFDIDPGAEFLETADVYEPTAVSHWRGYR